MSDRNLTTPLEDAPPMRRALTAIRASVDRQPDTDVQSLMTADFLALTLLLQAMEARYHAHKAEFSPSMQQRWRDALNELVAAKDDLGCDSCNVAAAVMTVGWHVCCAACAEKLAAVQ